MEYMTIKQASSIWGIDVSRIGKLIRAGKIAGVTKVGGHYLIEKGSPKPIDGRTIHHISIHEVGNFRYPIFAYQDSYYPPLSTEELQLKEAEEDFLKCDYDKANVVMADLPERANNRYCRIYALYMGCCIDMETNNVERFVERYNRLLLELQEDFPYKKEMSSLVYEVEVLLGHTRYFAEDFKIDSSYNYHTSYLPHLAELCTISLYCNVTTATKDDFNMCELECKLLEGSTNYYTLQSMYAFLSSVFAVVKQYDKMILYYRKALDIAQQYNCYYSVASQYYYMKGLLKTAFEGYDDKFKAKIEYLGNDMQKRFVAFSSKMSFNSIYENLSHREYILILYAVQGYTNKEIAGILNVSEVAIAKQYSELYIVTGATGKADLVNLYNKSINTYILKK